MKFGEIQIWERDRRFCAKWEIPRETFLSALKADQETVIQDLIKLVAELVCQTERNV